MAERLQMRICMKVNQYTQEENVESARWSHFFDVCTILYHSFGNASAAAPAGPHAATDKVFGL